jgi:hypothetical protein
MNQIARFKDVIGLYSPIDVLLADVAVRVQPTPTEYLTAVKHYEVMGEWVDRPGSPLRGRVQLFYPQGGFSTGSTVAAHNERTEFDLDAMLQVDWPRNVDPEYALATTHLAIAGEPGSRYYDKAERKTRCTQVQYDGMHLDVTPAVLLGEFVPKTSFIFHSKPSDPSVREEALFANPDGLANWFNARTLHDDAFGHFFEERSLAYDRNRLAVMKADTSPVPAQMPLYRKSRQVICLQLIKRWRNVVFDRRHKGLRLPPSVLLTYYVGLHTNITRTLIDELIYHVDCIITKLVAATSSQTGLVHECNPMCDADILTDRWPGDRANQKLFIDELRDFSGDLKKLKAGMPLLEMRKILEKLFGEKPAGDAVNDYASRIVNDNLSGGLKYIPGVGSIPAVAGLATPSIARAVPKSTPFGD